MGFSANFERKMTIVTYTGGYKDVAAMFWSKEQKEILRGGN